MISVKTQTLYRPVGLRELELIQESGWRRFPPRLEWQPIFYPVLNEAYAVQIAREWNVPDAFSGYLGAVTRFEVDETFLSRYAVQEVGAAVHAELWVPAEELELFNDHIAGKIGLTKAFSGEGFELPQNGELRDLLKRLLAQQSI